MRIQEYIVEFFLTLSLVSVASEAVGVLNCERGILNGRLRCVIDLKKKRKRIAV
jgi:hypothetical protein